ncbi:MAG TPA: polyprenyl synthetase family protein [Firmicutes bacterium]|jgi:heptaprenyl diphosphate synthase|nr:polyprenyl synthetase family protein [Bacillota bacterium]
MLSDIFAPVTPQLEMVHRALAASLRLEGITDPTRPVLTYVLGSRGKQLRAALVLIPTLGEKAADSGDRSRRAIQAGTAVELIHLATLLHDDVLDEAGERRGRPTLSVLWGNKNSILAGDYFFARAFGILAEINCPALLNLFTSAIATTCAGEIEEHQDSYNMEISEENYLQRIGKKTASLFAACARAGGLLAGKGREEQAALERFGYNLGIAFQLTDDLLDIIGDPNQLGKPVGQDLLQGVYTLPVLVALAEPATGKRLRRILARGLDRNNLEEIRSLVANSQGREATRQMALEYKTRALRELQALPPGPVRDNLARMAQFVVERIF